MQNRGMLSELQSDDAKHLTQDIWEIPYNSFGLKRPNRVSHILPEKCKPSFVYGV
jgi:hypothetical protein